MNKGGVFKQFGKIKSVRLKYNLWRRFIGSITKFNAKPRYLNLCRCLWEDKGGVFKVCCRINSRLVNELDVWCPSNKVKIALSNLNCFTLNAY